MKKLLFVALIGAFVACNETKTEEAVVDTAVTTVENALDSAGAAMDSLAVKVDSAAGAVVDSLKK